MTASPPTRPASGQTAVSPMPASITAVPSGTTARRPYRSAARPAAVEEDGAEGVHEEDQAGGRGVERVRRGLQPEGQGVEHRDERAHQQRAGRVEPEQDRVGEHPAGGPQQRAQPGPARHEPARRRQQQGDRDRADQPEGGGAAEREPPAAEVVERAGQQPAGHPAEGVAADVEPDGAAGRRRVQLLVEVGDPAAGRPASAKPCSARPPSSSPQVGATAHSAPSAVAAASEAWTRRVRPYRSENGPATSSPSASVEVVRLTESVEAVGLTPKARDRSGSSGCVL